MMKKIFFIISIITLTTFALTSCSDDKALPSLVLSQTSDIVFDADGTGSVVITLATDQENWNAVSNQTWCIVTKDATNTKFTVTALANPTDIASPNAVITVTAGGAAPVTINVSQTLKGVVQTQTMPYAEGSYYGDYYFQGMGVYYLYVYQGEDEADPNFKALQITGYTDLQPAKTFKLTPGTYILNQNGAAVNSFFAGTSTNREGTMLYTIKNEEFWITDLVTGGTMDVALSGDIYTITVDMTTKDPVTRQPRENIKYSYTGKIVFLDPFFIPPGPYQPEDIKSSTYVATGTPVGKVSPTGPATWTGTITPVVEDVIGGEPGEKRYSYKISNWANMATPETPYDVSILLENGYLIVDKTPLVINEDGSFESFYPIGFNKEDLSYGLQVDNTQFTFENNTLNFSLEDEWNFAAVGVLKFSEWATFEQQYGSEVYRDLKLVLTNNAGVKSFGTPSAKRANGQWFSIEAGKAFKAKVLPNSKKVDKWKFSKR